MREILNPYNKYNGYYCFGCAPNNEHGLQMTFYEDGDEIVSKWETKDFFRVISTCCMVAYNLLL